MPRNQMLIAVGQAVLLSVLGWTISHHLLNSAYQNASQHHIWREWLDAMDMIENATANGTVSSNSSFNNITFTDDHATFYWKTVPRDILFTTIISPLYYYWHIWLERSFPARPRPVGTSEKVADDTSHEEDVIQKWIAQGKIRRASLSWWNTLVKWTLNLVVGSLWVAALHALLSDLYALRLPKYSLSSLKWDIPMVLAGSFIGIAPLSDFVAFLVIPAHQRIVFEAGTQAVWEVFCSAFVGLFLPWLADTEFVGMIVGNITEKARNETQPQLGHLPSLPDEL
ncbi:hypothetical protein PRZ48_008016 [Zasmidium cellare]|uniref:Uncharacterized protein n=1 Tax=Zasmidium cellare TaxID=395010 RepID=A0ABR0EFD3_ZASCE|nr:hypothetical protein PRZ48_008016 [Zasmidium cellare]